MQITQVIAGLSAQGFTVNQSWLLVFSDVAAIRPGLEYFTTCLLGWLFPPADIVDLCLLPDAAEFVLCLTIVVPLLHATGFCPAHIMPLSRAPEATLRLKLLEAELFRLSCRRVGRRHEQTAELTRPLTFAEARQVVSVLIDGPIDEHLARRAFSVCRARHL